jgi:hypothetical protein
MTPPSEPDTTAPDAPAGLSATASSTRVDLSWSASPDQDLAGYRVYRSVDAGKNFSEITKGLLTSTVYADTGLQNGTTYTYVVRAEDTSGNLSSASTQASATPQAPAEPVVVFADGFESGNLLAGSWSVQNSDAFASAAASSTGGWGARLVKKSWMERSISTVGFTGLQLSYMRRTAGLDNNEFLHVEWWTGSAWRVLESTKDTAFAARSWTLPAAAENNPSFRIRFRIAANRADEWGDVDQVTVMGVPSN